MCSHPPGINCDMLYLEFYSTHYCLTLEEAGVHDLTQIRDFDETDDVRETNRLICECQGMDDLNIP
jgi:hypothetical protein